jgi:hypothetical protein
MPTETFDSPMEKLALISLGSTFTEKPLPPSAFMNCWRPLTNSRAR